MAVLTTLGWAFLLALREWALRHVSPQNVERERASLRQLAAWQVLRFVWVFVLTVGVVVVGVIGVSSLKVGLGKGWLFGFVDDVAGVAANWLKLLASELLMADSAS